MWKMVQRSCIVLCASHVLTIALRAQGVAAGGGAGPALDRFITFAALAAEPVAALQQRWPMQIRDGAMSTRFLFTPAQSIYVAFERDRARSDTALRIGRVSLVEQLPDSSTLRERVTAALRQLVALYGPAVECQGAPGGPGALFTAQRTTRGWPRGPKGRPVELTWEVSADRTYALRLTGGTVVPRSDDEDRYPCANSPN